MIKLIQPGIYTIKNSLIEIEVNELKQSIRILKQARCLDRITRRYNVNGQTFFICSSYRPEIRFPPDGGLYIRGNGPSDVQSDWAFISNISYEPQDFIDWLNNLKVVLELLEREFGDQT